jgi:hypothetical protein
MELSESFEEKLNVVFVAGLMIFILIFWFIVIPTA